jgi:single-stranded-DNA-specific exonuclease
MEKWIETRKGADFTGIAKRHGIDPVIARIIRNRDIITDEEIEKYLHGNLSNLNDPHLLKDADFAVDILIEKVRQGKKIRIIGDYDIDGVNATYILLKALQKSGAHVDYAIPDRIKDGYGINEHLIERANTEQVDTIITCDNGIAAIDAIAYAKKHNMTVIVTDHHDIPYIEEDGIRTYKRSKADAIVNPKQSDCPYPYKELCGAAVAFKFVQILYEKMQINGDAIEEFLENAAFATIGDVMNLTGENRILVKEGLKSFRHTQNLGMQALIAQNKLDIQSINTYHIGFVLGPCLNACGRLDTVEYALELLMTTDESKAAALANQLVTLNEQRKELTLQQLEEAIQFIEREQMQDDKVIVIYLPECHESLAGIIAGRIRERYYRPVFVLTRGDDAIKGSGRSIEEYSMYDEMNQVSELFTKFGGHPMAAGLSMEERNWSVFREKINAQCKLSIDDLTEKVRIDIPVPIGYSEVALIEQLKLLEPCGKGNSKPVFADRGVHIKSARVMGKNRNVLKLELSGSSGGVKKAVYFGDVDAFLENISITFGRNQVGAMLKGAGNNIEIAIIYDLTIDRYNGAYEPQIVIRKYRMG